jgi:hypothetical protein
MFESKLPSPDSRATPQVQKMAEDLYAAGDSCLALGPGANWNDAQQVSSQVADANTQLKSAKMILVPYFP